MKTEKPHLIVPRTANRENLKNHTELWKHMDPLLFEVSQKVKANNYHTAIIKIYLVAYPDSIMIK